MSMPPRVRLFEEIMVVAAILWVAAIVIGHNTHVQIFMDALGMESDYGAVSKLVYAALLSVTVFNAVIIYLVSRGGHNYARVIFIIVCVSGFILLCANMPYVLVLYSQNIVVATLQLLSFGLMVVSAFIITIFDTDDWFSTNTKCRECQSRLLGKYNLLDSDRF